MARGDRLILYTDGITGARDAGEAETGTIARFEPAIDEFGEDRLVELAVAHRSKSAAELQALLVDAAKAHSGGTFSDDATLIVWPRAEPCWDETPSQRDQAAGAGVGRRRGRTRLLTQCRPWEIPA